MRLRNLRPRSSNGCASAANAFMPPPSCDSHQSLKVHYETRELGALLGRLRIARPRQVDRHVLDDAARPIRHDGHPVGEETRLRNAVRGQQYGLAKVLTE